MELKLCEPQDACYRRMHTKYQLLKCPWSKVTMCWSWGICMEKMLKKKTFSTIKSGYFLTSCDDMAHHKVKELTRTFQDHVVGPCGSSMVLRYDGCHVMQQLFAHLSGTIFFPSHAKTTQHKFGTDISWWLVATNKRIGLCNSHRVWLLHRRGLNGWFDDLDIFFGTALIPLLFYPNEQY